MQAWYGCNGGDAVDHGDAVVVVVGLELDEGTAILSSHGAAPAAHSLPSTPQFTPQNISSSSRPTNHYSLFRSLARDGDSLVD